MDDVKAITAENSKLGPPMVTKMSFDTLQKDFNDLKTAHEKLEVAHSELLANCEVLKSQIPKPEASATAGLPPVGSEVIFVNHAGTHEKAKVTGHGNLGAHLDIQGGHVNDKYKRQEVPKGGPGKNLSFF